MKIDYMFYLDTLLLYFWLSGDDAGQVMWADLDKNLILYASHQSFIKATADLLKCHW